MDKKILNKKGYVLVYAIGLVSLLILLAASLMNFTMMRSNWVNKNVKNIKDISKVKTQVEAASSELVNYFEAYRNNLNKYLYELNAEFEVLFLDIESKYGVTIRDLTKESCEYPNNIDKPVCYPVKLESYTYAYEVVYQENGLTAQKRFFLSMIPSFLYFGLGSRTDLTINGGAYVHGDIYVNNNLYLTDSANYILDNQLQTQQSTFLTVNKINSIYLNNKLYSCGNDALTPCYTHQLTPRMFARNDSNFTEITQNWEYSMTFTGTPPLIKKYSDKFLEVDFDSSFIYYINQSIGERNRLINLTNINAELQAMITEGKLYVASTISDINNQSALSVIFRAPKTTINTNVTFTKDKWIIINGDLEIAYYGYPAINIDANFLVTGKISISGNVSLNSTIYTLGTGLVHNASINNINTDNQLVLLTKDTLQFSRINEFDNDFSRRIVYDSFNDSVTITPDIRGFFYTERNIQIFTVFSYIAIEGGVFANDGNNKETITDYIEDTNSIGLVINSYRGPVEQDLVYGTYEFMDPMNYLESRLIIEHDNSIIKLQPKGLPLNEQINYLFEDVTVK